MNKDERVLLDKLIKKLIKFSQRLSKIEDGIIVNREIGLDLLSMLENIYQPKIQMGTPEDVVILFNEEVYKEMCKLTGSKHIPFMGIA